MFFLKFLTAFSLMFLLSSCGSNVQRHADVEAESILLEDAENGLSSQWYTARGDTDPEVIDAHNESQSCVNLPVDWQKVDENNWHNPHEYHLTIDRDTADVLSVDVGGTGMKVPHYILGVYVRTEYGMRTLLWDSFYTHENLKSKITYQDDGSATLIFPSPVELVRGFGFEDTHTWSEFKVNLHEALHHFEAGNSITHMEYFIATGGNLDNIRVLRY